MKNLADQWGRRMLLRGAVLAGTAGLVGLRPERALTEPPPEITRLRLLEVPIICGVPQFVALELLKSEGFTDVQYVPHPTGWNDAIPAGAVDISMLFGPPTVVQIDAGAPLVVLGGSHIGCVELFGSTRIRTTRDLKGKTIAVSELRGDEHIFLSMFIAHVGVNPQRDINWLVRPLDVDVRQQLLVERKVDAFMHGPPFSLELRGRKVGHVLVNTTTDRPWSQYFYCVIAGHKDFVRRHPVATKRAVRALLKAADVCALEPERVARLIMERRLAPRYEYALQTLREIPYGRWRQYDGEDALRFYALRLHEAGLIKSSPQQILAQGTDWRFFNELKKELKG